MYEIEKIKVPRGMPGAPTRSTNARGKGVMQSHMQETQCSNQTSYVLSIVD